MSLSLQGTGAGGSTAHAVGTYTGTGSAITLTFDAPVQAMIIESQFSPALPSDNQTTVCWIIGDKGYCSPSGNSPMRSISPTLSGNSITIPSNFSANGTAYRYIAFF